MVERKRWLCLILLCSPLSGTVTKEHIYALVQRHPYPAGMLLFTSLLALSLLRRGPQPHPLENSAWTHFADKPTVQRHPLYFTHNQNEAIQKLSMLCAQANSAFPVATVGNYKFFWKISLHGKQLSCATIVAIAPQGGENSATSHAKFSKAYLVNTGETPRPAHVAHCSDVRANDEFNPMPLSSLTDRFSKQIPPGVPLKILPLHPYPQANVSMYSFLRGMKEPSIVVENQPQQPKIFIEADSSISLAAIERQYHKIGIPLRYAQGAFWLTPSQDEQGETPGE